MISEFESAVEDVSLKFTLSDRLLPEPLSPITRNTSMNNPNKKLRFVEAEAPVRGLLVPQLARQLLSASFFVKVDV